MKAVTDVLTAPKNIGNNKWVISNPLDLQIADDFLHIHQLRAQSSWVAAYWEGYKEVDIYAHTTARDNSAFLMGHDFYRKYVRADADRRLFKILRPFSLNLNNRQLFSKFAKVARLNDENLYLTPAMEVLTADYLDDGEYFVKTSLNEETRRIDYSYNDYVFGNRISNKRLNRIRVNTTTKLLDLNPTILTKLNNSFKPLPTVSTIIEGNDFSPKSVKKSPKFVEILEEPQPHIPEVLAQTEQNTPPKKPTKPKVLPRKVKMFKFSPRVYEVIDKSFNYDDGIFLIPKWMYFEEFKLRKAPTKKVPTTNSPKKLPLTKFDSNLFFDKVGDTHNIFNPISSNRTPLHDFTDSDVYPYKVNVFGLSLYDDEFDNELITPVDTEELDDGFAELAEDLTFTRDPEGLIFGHSESVETSFYSQKGQSIQTPLRIIKYPLNFIKLRQDTDLIELVRTRFGSGSQDVQQKLNTHQTY